MATLLRGAEVVSALNETIQADVIALRESGLIPTLAILRVGEKPDDLAYERGAIKRAETVGISVRQIVLPESVSQETLLEQIERHIQLILLRPNQITIRFNVGVGAGKR